MKSTRDLTHQDVNFPVNLETEVTFDTLLTEYINVDFLVLAAEPAHFCLPLFHVHSCLLVNKCLLTYTLDNRKVGIHARRFVSYSYRRHHTNDASSSSIFSFTNIYVALWKNAAAFSRP